MENPLFMREMKEKSLFCFFNSLDLLKMQIALILGKKRLEKLTNGDYLYLTCTSYKKQLDKF